MLIKILKNLESMLTELFPDSTIYMDNAPDAITKPAFTVHLVQQNFEKQLWSYKNKLEWELLYDPADGVDRYENCLETLQCLNQNLKSVAGCRVRNCEGQITDGVLHFLFQMEYREMDVVEEEKINQMKQNFNVKEK